MACLLLCPLHALQSVRGDLKRHYAAAALGVGAFFAEDLVMYSGWGGYVHAGEWLLNQSPGRVCMRVQCCPGVSATLDSRPVAF